MGGSSSKKEDVLERKIEERSRQLAEEKQASMREKIHVGRLHRDLARYKGDKDVKEQEEIEIKYRQLSCSQKEPGVITLKAERNKKTKKAITNTTKKDKRGHGMVKVCARVRRSNDSRITPSGLMLDNS